MFEVGDRVECLNVECYVKTGVIVEREGLNLWRVKMDELPYGRQPLVFTDELQPEDSPT